jgi:hypothetical protein
MTREGIAKDILNYAGNKPGMSFIEVERVFQGHGFEYEGDRGIFLPGYPNIIVWANWNKKATGIITEMLNAKRLKMNPASELVYIIDGAIPAFPLAKRLIRYKEPHWLPMVLNIGGSK